MAVVVHSATRGAGFVTMPLTQMARAAGSMLRYWQYREQFRRLGELSDWQLADIGLMRGDLRDAWASRVNADPFQYLAKVARSRCTLDDAARRVS